MMREDQLLKAIAMRSAAVTNWPGVIVGPSDDAAVLSIDREPTRATTPTPHPTGNLLITTDQLIEARHVPALSGSTPDERWLDQTARKAIARSVSDIAAMGGTPIAAVATGAIPAARAWSHATADALFERLKHWAESFACPLVGGDIATTDGPLVLTTTVLATPHPARGPVLRAGARPGDAVWVTGALGGSLASGRHWSFTPRIREANALCDALGTALHAMMDLSDGLAIDADRLADASAVAITLRNDHIPRHPGVDADDGWREALGDGEDYELLLTTDPSIDDHTIRATLAPFETMITRIGTAHAAEPSCANQCRVRLIDRAGNEHPLHGLGWLHT